MRVSGADDRRAETIDRRSTPGACPDAWVRSWIDAPACRHEQRRRLALGECGEHRSPFAADALPGGMERPEPGRRSRTSECRQPRVPVLVGDSSVRPALDPPDIGFPFVTFNHEIPNFFRPCRTKRGRLHGYAVTLTLGRLFNPRPRLARTLPPASTSPATSWGPFRF